MSSKKLDQIVYFSDELNYKINIYIIYQKNYLQKFGWKIGFMV